MDIFQNLVLTEVYRPMNVFSQQGTSSQMTNRKSYGLSLCLSGHITYVLDGVEYHSTPGNIVILPKGKSYTLHRKATGTFLLVNFQCTGFACETFCILPLQNQQAYIKDYELLQKLYSSPHNRLLCFSVVYRLLNHVATHPQYNALTPALRYLEEHLADPNLNNNALSAQAGISEVYFRKLFAEQFHTTPRQYILDRRLQNATDYLTSTDLSVSAIAERCGFASVYHFSRAFRARFGFTPSQYAAQHRVFDL